MRANFDVLDVLGAVVRAGMMLALVLTAGDAWAQEAGAARGFVGLWAEERGLVVSHSVAISIDARGVVRATWCADGVVGLEGGEEMEAVSITAKRLELRGAEETIVVERRGATLRLARVSPEGPSPYAMLLRRDGLWLLMRSDVRDMGHEADGAGYAAASYEALRRLVDELRSGIKAGGGAARLEDEVEAACAYTVVAQRVFGDASGPPLRKVGQALAEEAARRGSLCAAVARYARPCLRVRITDRDGTTTVRTAPSSRSAPGGSVPAGQERAVRERRGRWLRIDEGWVFASNTACVAK